MGISVLNGMVTSVAASLPLFFCQLQFFAKLYVFGVFIFNFEIFFSYPFNFPFFSGLFLCFTIAFSWIFANFGFMSILAQFKIPLKKDGWRL